MKIEVGNIYVGIDLEVIRITEVINDDNYKFELLEKGVNAYLWNPRHTMPKSALKKCFKYSPAYNTPLYKAVNQ